MNKDHLQLAQIQSEKMASLGTIAAGVAHEINNPLSFLLSNLQSLTNYSDTFVKQLKQYENTLQNIQKLNPEKSITTLITHSLESSNKKEYQYMLKDYSNLLAESLEGIERIRSIISNLLTFSRPNGEAIEPTNINLCIETALKLLSVELKYKCTVRTELGSLDPFLCNPSRLLQVFINVILNGCQAIEQSDSKKGLIKIKTVQMTDKYIINISDNGCGIEENLKEKLFTPFFTTKPAGQGTGLGLSVTYGIVQELKGTISIDSKVGQGTTVTIELPNEGKKNHEK